MQGQATQTIGVSTSIQKLLPDIRKRRAEIEQARRLPRDLADALRGTGVFRLSIPRAIGGDEARPLDILNAVETIAAADGSTGWCAMIGIGSNVLGEVPAAAVFAGNPARMLRPNS